MWLQHHEFLVNLAKMHQVYKVEEVDDHGNPVHKIIFFDGSMDRGNCVPTTVFYFQDAGEASHIFSQITEFIKSHSDFLKLEEKPCEKPS